ncbi:MAG: hypothetical protein WA843_05090 [Candidatus Saccharimonadales bacterium]
MNKIPCPELCPDCPLLEYAPNEPRHLKVVGERTIPEVTTDGHSVTIGWEYKTGPKEKEVAIMSEGAKSGPAFWVKERIGLPIVRQAFESCKQPTVLKSGFLKRNKQVVCGGLSNLREH